MSEKNFVQIALKDRLNAYQLHKSFSEEIKKPTKKQKLYRQKLELMSYQEDFSKSVEKLRKNNNIPKTGFPSFSECRKWAERQSKSKYDNELTSLVERSGIALRWFDAVEYYVLFNKTDVWDILPTSVGLKLMKDPESGNESLFLQIYKDTKIEDIKLKWNIIQKMKGLIKPYDYKVIRGEEGFVAKSTKTDHSERARDISNRKDRKLESMPLRKRRKAYDLYKQGLSYEEIGKEIGCMYNEVGIHIHRFKKEIRDVKLD